MPLFWQRLALETKDRIRHDRFMRRCVASAIAASAGRGTTPQECAQAVVQLCKSARLAVTDQQMLRVERAIRKRIDAIGGRPIDWGALDSDTTRKRIEHALVLKPYLGEREPGVVMISFEYQWSRLTQIQNLGEFARRYKLVVSPTWCPPHVPGVCLFPHVYPGKILSMISHADDLRILPRLAPNFSVVPLYASNWVHPDLYQPVPFAQKDIDLVMIANFSEYKRHFALFRALRDMPRSTRVVLIGRPLKGRTAQVLRQEAAAYGVADRFELLENATDAQVNGAVAGAKVSVILSRQEGSCVAVVESMFANTPVGLFHDARIGSRAFIGPETGRFLQHENLGRQLQEFIAEAERYSPRRWVLENGVSCFGSTETLNRVLREEALGAGQEWTQDIAAHHWRPHPELVSDLDRERFAPEYEDILGRFGVHFGFAAGAHT